MYLVYFSAVVLCALYYYTNYRRRLLRLEKMVERFDGPPVIPIFGNALQFVKSPPDFMKVGKELLTTYNHQFRFWMLNKPFIVIGSPEDFEIVAHKTLEKDRVVYKFVTDMVGDSIGTSKVEKWKKHRHIIAPGLNPNVYFDHFLSVFNKYDKDLVKRLHKEVGTEKHFDLWPYTLRISILKLCETTLGYDDKEADTEAKNYGHAIIKSSELIYKRFFNVFLMPSINFTLYKYLYGYGDIGEKTRNLPMKVLKKRKEELKRLKNGEGKELRNAIDVLLSTGVITDEDVYGEVNMLMAAGSETTALITSFTILMLGIEQDVQEKVYREIFEVFGNSDRLPEQSDLNRLPYLKQCIKETLRQFSVVPVTFREAPEDILITNGKIIPAGASVCLSPYSVHKNPDIYPNPDTWDPSNFDPDKVAGRHKCSFVPFSTGPRGCVGEKYAYLSLKAQISTLLRNFKVTTDVKAKDIELTMDIVIRSIHGYNVKLEYRHGRPLF